MSKIKNFIASAMAALVLCSTDANAGGAAEVEVTNKDTTIDARLSYDVNNTLNIFGRTRLSIDYEGNTSQLGVVDLNFSLDKGFSALVEAHYLSNRGVIPRFGFGYFTNYKSFSVYCNALASLQDSPDAELYTVVKFRPKLSKTITLIADSELILGFDKDINYFIERVWAGVDFGVYSVGAYQQSFITLEDQVITGGAFFRLEY